MGVKSPYFWVNTHIFPLSNCRCFLLFSSCWESWDFQVVCQSQTPAPLKTSLPEVFSNVFCYLFEALDWDIYIYMYIDIVKNILSWQGQVSTWHENAETSNPPLLLVQGVSFLGQRRPGKTLAMRTPFKFRSLVGLNCLLFFKEMSIIELILCRLNHSVA